MGIKTDLQPACHEARQILGAKQREAKLLSWGNLLSFFSNFGFSARVMFRDPEILFFAIVQWLCIGLSYVVWTQGLAWIPDEVWRSAEAAAVRHEKHPYMMVDLLLAGWGALILVIVSYPIGIFSAAVVAAPCLRESGRNSTVWSCLSVATGNVGRLWAFTLVDSWTTVSMILKRIPKKRRADERRDHSVVDEVLYYAWKIGTVGVIPALVNGRGMVDAGRESLRMLRAQPLEVIGVRMGYSLVCWVVGVAAWFGCGYYYASSGIHHQQVHWLYHAYYLLALPIFIAAGIVTVLIRPFYLIMISFLYIDSTASGTEQYELAPVSLFSWHLLLFFLLTGSVVTLYFMGDQWGVGAWVEQLAQQDMRRYGKLGQ